MEYRTDGALANLLAQAHRSEMVGSRSYSLWDRLVLRIFPATPPTHTALEPRVNSSRMVGQIEEAAEHLMRWHTLAHRPQPLVVLELVRHTRGLPKDRIRALATEYELQIRGLVGMVGGVVVPQWELQVYHDLPEFGYNFDTLLLIWFPSKQAFYQLATSAQYEEVYDRHIAEVHAHIMLALKPFRLDTGMLYGGEL
eukprot:TRINITY_DN5999_c0_g1_i2.p1 TRINITY_DN5999_c0_g1~~TRINITY_DN5999_c0_g1_i2.p1  ORF type:complete len:197 (-),score=53.42 TRINITY_DN5999_c0_g1_i2:276-866(-)